MTDGASSAGAGPDNSSIHEKLTEFAKLRDKETGLQWHEKSYLKLGDNGTLEIKKLTSGEKIAKYMWGGGPKITDVAQFLARKRVDDSALHGLYTKHIDHQIQKEFYTQGAAAHDDSGDISGRIKQKIEQKNVIRVGEVISKFGPFKIAESIWGGTIDAVIKTGQYDVAMDMAKKMGADAVTRVTEALQNARGIAIKDSDSIKVLRLVQYYSPHDPDSSHEEYSDVASYFTDLFKKNTITTNDFVRMCTQAYREIQSEEGKKKFKSCCLKIIEQMRAEGKDNEDGNKIFNKEFADFVFTSFVKTGILTHMEVLTQFADNESKSEHEDIVVKKLLSMCSAQELSKFKDAEKFKALAKPLQDELARLASGEADELSVMAYLNQLGEIIPDQHTHDSLLEIKGAYERLEKIIGNCGDKDTYTEEGKTYSKQVAEQALKELETVFKFKSSEQIEAVRVVVSDFAAIQREGKLWNRQYQSSDGVIKITQENVSGYLDELSRACAKSSKDIDAVINSIQKVDLDDERRF